MNKNIEKEDRQPDAIFSGYVARDKDGSLYLYRQVTPPIRDKEHEEWTTEVDSYNVIGLNPNLLPEITWEDEPELVRFDGYLRK